MNKYFFAVVKDNRGEYRTIYFQGHSAKEAAEDFHSNMGVDIIGLADDQLEGETDLYDYIASVLDENYMTLIKMYAGPKPVHEIQ